MSRPIVFRRSVKGEIAFQVEFGPYALRQWGRVCELGKWFEQKDGTYRRMMAFERRRTRQPCSYMISALRPPARFYDGWLNCPSITQPRSGGAK